MYSSMVSWKGKKPDEIQRRGKFFHPVDDLVEWVKAGANFGYRSILLGIDIAIIYGAVYACNRLSSGCSCTKPEKTTEHRTSKLENVICGENTYLLGDSTTSSQIYRSAQN